jgi:hypothetical protein
MAVIAGLLVAALALPVLEASLFTSRESVGFGQFISHSNTPAQMLSLLVPAIDHETREAPTYVGVVTLLLALAAVPLARRNWRVPFWVAVAIAGWALEMGATTPATHVAFWVPLYSKFRIVGRHVFLSSFAVCALAGFAIAAIQQQTLRRRAVAIASALLAAAVAATVWAIRRSPAAFPLSMTDHGPWALPVFEHPLWGACAIAALAVAAALVFARHHASRVAATCLVAMFVADLLHANGYGITPAGLTYGVLQERAVQPSVHAERLRAALAPAHQRFLAPAGTHLDALVPATFARLWRLPIAGGYGPMLLAHYADVTLMERNGSVQPTLLASSDRALDLMAVRRVAIPATWLEPGAVVRRDGVEWTEAPLGLSVGPPGCGQNGVRSASLAFPADLRVSEVALAVRLRCSEDVPQDAEVADLVVTGAEPRVLRAGREVSDESLSGPDRRSRVRHGLATVFDPSEQLYSYVVRVRLPQPRAGVKIDIALRGTNGSMQVDRLTAIDAEGRSWPQSQASAMLSDASRWQAVDRVRTSRRTDRGHDEEAAGEEPYLILENRRAQPRTWLAGEAVPLTAAALDRAVHFSVLPDGRTFDPARMALVEAGVPAVRMDSGRTDVTIRSADGGGITVDARSEHGGVLVVSEVFYPGWTARVDGADAEILRVNGTIQGVRLNGGAHVVEFRFASRTLSWGRILSASGGLLTIAVFVWSRRRTRTALPD